MTAFRALVFERLAQDDDTRVGRAERFADWLARDDRRLDERDSAVDARGVSW